MTASDRRRVRALREHATRLRQLADAITSEANALEAELSSAPLLGGRALVDVAVAVLIDTPNHTLHYHRLLVGVEANSGMQVRGVNPAATLLANLDRNPRVRSCGNRSGRYTLAADPSNPPATHPGPLADVEDSDRPLPHTLAQDDPAQTPGDRLRATGSRSIPPRRVPFAA